MTDLEGGSSVSRESPLGALATKTAMATRKAKKQLYTLFCTFLRRCCTITTWNVNRDPHFFVLNFYTVL